MLAGYFSKAGNSGQIPVDYTEIRNVHKPSGAKPGFVTYDNQKTLFATPDYDKIQSMKVKYKRQNYYIIKIGLEPNAFIHSVLILFFYFSGNAS